ncbi:MAG: DUF4835 family protein [Bacteroidales bacterium]|nr:DUF4835 family protein [Bacteroidales bacterium]
MKKLGYLILLLLVSLGTARSQELTCYVSVNSSKIQGTNKEIFNTLQDAITDFMNNTTWTNHVYEVNERIECNLMLYISEEVTTGQYTASLTIQSRRPIYGSSYNSVLFNYVDQKVEFEYTEFDPLEFSETTHLDNLTSILAYYAYIVLGLDYDSFSPNGGDPYFQKAEKIVNNAQSANEHGWKASDARGRDNRYWLINNIRDEAYQPVREFNYNYHRQGMDLMDNSPDRGRLAIKDALIDLEKFYKNKPDPFMHYFTITIEAKSTEIVNIFSEAPQADKSRIFEIMNAFDPANSSKYAVLKE